MPAVWRSLGLAAAWVGGRLRRHRGAPPTSSRCARSSRRRATTAHINARRASWRWPIRTLNSPRPSSTKVTTSVRANTWRSPTTTRARRCAWRASAARADADAQGQAGHRRQGRRRHQGRRRQVPERPRGQGWVRGRGRLPRPRQRQGRHPRHQGQVPERARGQGRVRGRRRLP